MAWAPKARKEVRKSDYKKPEYSKLYKDVRWWNTRETGASQVWIKENPLCAECKRHGIDRPAQCVDHIKPHRGDLERFWNRDNWQSLCDPCHTEKTRRGE